jgi:hypothetical protein
VASSVNVPNLNISNTLQHLTNQVVACRVFLINLDIFRPYKRIDFPMSKVLLEHENFRPPSGFESRWRPLLFYRWLILIFIFNILNI